MMPCALSLRTLFSQKGESLCQQQNFGQMTK